jgi:hypothetical protein
LKLKCDEPLSNFAFNFNLRRYIMGTVKLSDVMRLLLVYAEDVGGDLRPPRATMQSFLRRITALADTDRKEPPPPPEMPPKARRCPTFYFYSSSTAGSLHHSLPFFFPFRYNHCPSSPTARRTSSLHNITSGNHWPDIFFYNFSQDAMTRTIQIHSNSL